MADLYTNLQVSPRKKRCPPSPRDDNTLTPKKLRTAPPTPPATVCGRVRKAATPCLPSHLTRLQTIQTGLQHALSHALATCAVSPSEMGIVRNVLNYLSLSTYTGLTTQFTVEDLRRLCWIWEWDGELLPREKAKAKFSMVDEEDNPFLDHGVPTQPKDWTRGSMGFVISPAAHAAKHEGKRVPTYGIGIEVEMDMDKDMGGGMAAVARWTAEAEMRRSEFRQKLERWVELHSGADQIPHIPLADLPPLPAVSKTSSLTRLLVSASPKGSPAKLLATSPSLDYSPSKPSLKSPAKRSTGLTTFATPLPVKLSSRLEIRPEKNSILFPKTPSSHHNRPDPVAALLTPRTPTTSASSIPPDLSTPAHQRGVGVATTPQTPTSRRQALYERVRQRSLSLSPTKSRLGETAGGSLTRDQILKLGQEEMRRRCLLGRLSGVAESVWMLFATPSGSTVTPTRKRKALPMSVVATAVIKSSPVAISTAEANESLNMLIKLCPFFLRQLDIGGEGWLEMPAPSIVDHSNSLQSLNSGPSSPGKSPGGKMDSAEELVMRSPRRVKRETGSLREVREIIRRELELQD